MSQIKFDWNYRPDSGFLASANRVTHGSGVTIATVKYLGMASVTISINACFHEAGFIYQVFDDEGVEYVLPSSLTHSQQPLSLLELVELIDSAERSGESEPEGMVVTHWRFYLECGEPLFSCARWAKINSDYYPQLAECYRVRARQWLRNVVAEERKKYAQNQAENAIRRRLLKPFANRIAAAIESEASSWSAPQSGYAKVAQSDKRLKLRTKFEDFVIKYGAMPSA